MRDPFVAEQPVVTLEEASPYRPPATELRHVPRQARPLGSFLPILSVTGSPESAAPRWFDLGVLALQVPIACLGGWLAIGRRA